MPKSALDIGKPSAYTMIRPSQAPLECISHTSVKGHHRERTGLFFFFQCINKIPKFFDERSCVMSLLVLPAPMAGGRLLWEGNASPRQPQCTPWVFPLAAGIACRQGQPPLLGHPQVHPWQPTQPPQAPQAPRWQRLVVLGLPRRVGEGEGRADPSLLLAILKPEGCSCTGALAQSSNSPKLLSVLVQDNAWAKK